MTMRIHKRSTSQVAYHPSSFAFRCQLLIAFQGQLWTRTDFKRPINIRREALLRHTSLDWFIFLVPFIFFLAPTSHGSVAAAPCNPTPVAPHRLCRRPQPSNAAAHPWMTSMFLLTTSTDTAGLHHHLRRPHPTRLSHRPTLVLALCCCLDLPAIRPTPQTATHVNPEP